jgi:hypothetical protein
LFFHVRNDYFFGWGLDGGIAFFFSADTNSFFDIRDEHFAVADFAGLGGFDDRGQGSVFLRIANDEFDFDLGQEIHCVFAAAIDFGMSLLTTEALDFANRHAFDTDFAQGVFDLFELEWFDDRFNFLHSFIGLNRATRQSAPSGATQFPPALTGGWLPQPIPAVDWQTPFSSVDANRMREI